MNADRLPPEILVQQPDGTKAKAVLLQWPVNGLPVYALLRSEASEGGPVQGEPEPEPCHECGGTGGVDSGGVTPWGSPISLPCPSCSKEIEEFKAAVKHLAQDRLASDTNRALDMIGKAMEP